MDIRNVLLFVPSGRAYCFMLGLRLMKKCLNSFPFPVNNAVGVGGLRKLLQVDICGSFGENVPQGTGVWILGIHWWCRLGRFRR